MIEVGQRFTSSGHRAESAALASGDVQPLHLDAAYAARTHFGRPIVPGLAILGQLATLLGTQLVDLDERYVVTEQMTLRLVRPVFVGDQVDVAATVVSWAPERNRLVLRVEARNQELAPRARRDGDGDRPPTRPHAVSAAGRAILGRLCW